MISFGGKSGPGQQPANWYPDPHRRAELRYWDGAQWTSFVSVGGTSYDERAGGPGVVGPPPATPLPIPAMTKAPWQPGKGFFIGFAVMFVIVLVFLGLSFMRLAG